MARCFLAKIKTRFSPLLYWSPSIEPALVSFPPPELYPHSRKNGTQRRVVKFACSQYKYVTTAATSEGGASMQEPREAKLTCIQQGSFPLFGLGQVLLEFREGSNVYTNCSRESIIQMSRCHPGAPRSAQSNTQCMTFY